MDDITTAEELAEVLSIVTGGEFTPDELLSNAHALMALAPDDSPPRRRVVWISTGSWPRVDPSLDSRVGFVMARGACFGSNYRRVVAECRVSVDRTPAEHIT